MQKSFSPLPSFIQDQWEKWPELAELHNKLSTENALRFNIMQQPLWVYSLSHRKNSAIGGYRKINNGSPLEPQYLLPNQAYYELMQGFHYMLNPFPIFNEHGIVCSAKPRPQELYGRLQDMLNIQQEIGIEYCVLYNGTASGASIPEHWHVHIMPKALFTHWEASPLLAAKNASMLNFFDDGIRRGVHLFMENDDLVVIQEKIDVVTQLLAEDLRFDESLLNVLLFKRTKTSVDIVLFLRKAHRHRYFPKTVDSAGILISPGIVDVLGHIVCSREDDLKTLTSLALKHIFEDIFIDRATFLEYTSFLKSKSD